MKSTFIIRAAKIKDMAAVAKMIQDLAIYHKKPEAAKLTVKDLEQDGFTCKPPAFKCQVAEVDKHVVGYAIYCNTYSSWAGRTMLLEDLYVMREQRKTGMGEALFDAVAKDAASSGCARLDGHVVQWNKAAAFFESKGGVNLTEKEQWCYFRVSGDALQRYADDMKCIPPWK